MTSHVIPCPHCNDNQWTNADYCTFCGAWFGWGENKVAIPIDDREYTLKTEPNPLGGDYSRAGLLLETIAKRVYMTRFATQELYEQLPWEALSEQERETVRATVTTLIGYKQVERLFRIEKSLPGENITIFTNDEEYGQKLMRQIPGATVRLLLPEKINTEKPFGFSVDLISRVLKIKGGEVNNGG